MDKYIFINNVLKVVVINFFKVIQFSKVVQLFKVVLLRLLKGVLLKVLYTSLCSISYTMFSFIERSPGCDFEMTRLMYDVCEVKA